MKFSRDIRGLAVIVGPPAYDRAMTPQTKLSLAALDAVPLLSACARGARVTHRGRLPIGTRAVVYVTWRTADDVGNLRGKSLFRQVRESLRRCCEKEGFRVIHFSVRGRSVHLIVEAEDAEHLARGMQGLGVSMAKRINRTLGRRGAAFSDRYYSRRLRTAVEVASAIEYVICNPRERSAHLDWRRAADRVAFTSDSITAQQLVRPPRFWLLRVGWWRRCGLSTWQSVFAMRSRVRSSFEWKPRAFKLKAAA